MKELTVIHDLQATTILKDISSDEALKMIVSAVSNAKDEYARCFRDDTDIDDVVVTGIHFFIRDQKDEGKEEEKQREIRELTERLLKLLSK